MAHWFNPLLFFFLAAIKSRESALGELRPVELIPSNFFTGFKAKISKEPTQGALRPIGLIPTNFFYYLQGNNIRRVRSRGTKDHWFNPSQVF